MITEESYTSGCSFLDKEEICRENYNPNRRINRGLFRSNEGILINAEVNSAYNRIEGVGLHPVRLNIA